MLEFGIAGIVLFALIFGLIDLALTEAGNSAASDAARSGARLGVIDYVCADSYPGSPYESHDGCADPSAEYTAVKNNTLRHLNGLVSGSASIAVGCYQVPQQTGGTPTAEACTSNGVTSGQDQLQVSVTYTSISTSPLFAPVHHVETVRMTIVGAPSLATSTTTSSTSTTSTSTTSTSTTSTTAVAGPALQALLMQDVNADGKVDQVTATFTQPLNIGCALVSHWTLTNVPSGGSLTLVTISGATATLALAEGLGAADTSVGSFKIAFAPPIGCNAAAFGPTAPNDGAPPVPVSVASANHGLVPGKMEASDTLTMTFSEPILGAPAAPAVSEQDNGANTILGVPGVVTAGTGTMGSTYISANNKSASFASTLAGNGTPAVTMTLTGACSDNGGNACNKLVAGGPGAFTDTPDPGLHDAAGNAAVASSVSPTFLVRVF